MTNLICPMFIGLLLLLMYFFFNGTFFSEDFSFDVYIIDLISSLTIETYQLRTLILNLFKLLNEEFHLFELEYLF
jgi:hypothetical protein